MNEIAVVLAISMVGLILAVIDKKLDRLIDVVERGLARLS